MHTEARLSLGHRDLDRLSDGIIEEWSKKATWLDLSDNNIRYGSPTSLTRQWFVRFKTLCFNGVLDPWWQWPLITHQASLFTGLSVTVLFLTKQNLKTLWLNRNKIDNISIILDTLVQFSPNLTELSLLKNPCCPNYLTGGKPSEYTDYRFVFSHNRS